MTESTRPAESVTPPALELVIEREFDAPRELVFQAWSDPGHAKIWWAPHGFTVTLLEMDVRPGGAWRKCMRSPEGREYWRHGEFRQVIPPERLEFTYHSDDPNADPETAMLVTVTFAERDGRTAMVFRQQGFASVADRDAHRGGWSESIERLAGFVTRR